MYDWEKKVEYVKSGMSKKTIEIKGRMLNYVE